MKKFALLLCLMLIAGTVFAEVIPVVNIKPYFRFDNTPAAGATSDSVRNIHWPNTGAPNQKNVRDDWYMTQQDYWLEAFKNPGILDLGFVAKGDKFSVVFLLDFMQDTLAYFMDGNVGNFSNIPFLKHMIELNFPRMGYIDFASTDGSFYASVGRRQIHWGPAKYNMAISDSAPYLDNAYAQINIPMKNDWKFWYGFTGIANKYFLSDGHNIDDGYKVHDDVSNTETKAAVGPKTIFAHKFAFENENIRISFAELNTVYGKYPSLLDATPCGIWHDNYQDNYSNVMLDFSVEGKVGPVRAFGSFTMDDFILPHENSGTTNFPSNKPVAIGIVAGAEINLLDGKEVDSSKFNYQDYKLSEETFKVNKGLNLGYEFYYCSKFMYNRAHDAGKFTIPYQFISFAGNGYCYDENAFYLGFQYGPDTLLHRLYVEYTDNPIEAYASFGLMKRGCYGIDSTYGDVSYYNANLNNMYDISAPSITIIMVEAGCSYYVQSGLKANAEISFTKDLTHGTQALKATVGASIAVCDVDWKNLF